MMARVLGAAAGGGFPQWNCNCANCRRARSGDPLVLPRTQASVAVSADGVRWVLLNASPDLTAQIAAAPCLQPCEGAPGRGSPIAAVVISGGDIDCIAGLLSLRESQKLRVYAGGFVREIIDANSVFGVLNREMVVFENLPRDAEIPLCDADGEMLGLFVSAFGVEGKIPLYQETANNMAALASAEAVIGLCIRDEAGARVFYIPGCSTITPDLRGRLEGAEVLFFDGTLWQDDEMIAAGLGQKTGRRMGHVSVSGAQGSMAGLAGVRVGQKIFIHINNTNPILCADSGPAAQVRAAGWQIAHDGMEVRL